MITVKQLSKFCSNSHSSLVSVMILVSKTNGSLPLILSMDYFGKFVRQLHKTFGKSRKWWWFQQGEYEPGYAGCYQQDLILLMLRNKQSIYSDTLVWVNVQAKFLSLVFFCSFFHFNTNEGCSRWLKYQFKWSTSSASGILKSSRDFLGLIKRPFAQILKYKILWSINTGYIKNAIIMNMKFFVINDGLFCCFFK